MILTAEPGDFHLGYTIAWAVGAAACALFSFFFGTCEMAITTTSLNKWKQIATKKDTLCNRLVTKMLNNYQITLGVVLIGNVVTTIVASTFIANIVGQFVQEDILTFLSFMIAFFLLIFCEYLPKSLARNHPIRWLKTTGIPLYGFYIFLWPTSKLFSIMFARKNKIVDQNSPEYNIMNFNDALVSEKMIPIKNVELLILDGTKDEIIEKIISTKHLTLPVIDKNKKIIGCIRTDGFLKKYLNDKTANPSNYIRKLTLMSKNAHMSDVLTFTNSQRPIIGVIDLSRPNELVGVVSINHIMQLLSTDVFVED